MLLYTVSFKLTSILSSYHFASLDTKEDNCRTQHLARAFSVIGMLDFEHNDCMQSLYGLPGCIVCIGDSKILFWFGLLACQGSMHKEMVTKDCHIHYIPGKIIMFFFEAKFLVAVYYGPG